MGFSVFRNEVCVWEEANGKIKSCPTLKKPCLLQAQRESRAPLLLLETDPAPTCTPHIIRSNWVCSLFVYIQPLPLHAIWAPCGIRARVQAASFTVKIFSSSPQPFFSHPASPFLHSQAPKRILDPCLAQPSHSVCNLKQLIFCPYQSATSALARQLAGCHLNGL